VPIPAACGITGVILADQLKSLDWKAREARRIGRVPPSTMNEVIARLTPLIGW